MKNGKDSRNVVVLPSFGVANACAEALTYTVDPQSLPTKERVIYFASVIPEVRMAPISLEVNRGTGGT